MQQEIALTVQIIRSYQNSSDEEILEALIANGIKRYVAVQLVTLLPLAYGRAGLASAGVRFSDYYICMGQNGRPGRECKLNSLAVWNESIAFARKEISSGATADAVLAIAGRSPETNAINQALHGGEKLEDLVISPPAFIWPEFDSSAHADLCSKATRRWWQFWKP
jgi:hypothetical protein